MVAEVIELNALGTQPRFALRKPDGSLVRIHGLRLPVMFDSEDAARAKLDAEAGESSAER